MHPFWKPHPNAPLSSKGTAGIVANIRIHRNTVLHNSSPHQFNNTKRLTFLVPRYRLEKSGLAYRLRYFTLTRRTNEVSAPSGVIATLALPSAVQVTLTVRPSEENSNSFNSAAQTAAEMPSSLEILSGAMLTSRLKRRLAVIIRQNKVSFFRTSGLFRLAPPAGASVFLLPAGPFVFSPTIRRAFKLSVIMLCASAAAASVLVLIPNVT